MEISLTPMNLAGPSAAGQPQQSKVAPGFEAALQNAAISDSTTPQDVVSKSPKNLSPDQKAQLVKSDGSAKASGVKPELKEGTVEIPLEALSEFTAEQAAKAEAAQKYPARRQKAVVSENLPIAGLQQPQELPSLTALKASQSDGSEGAPVKDSRAPVGEQPKKKLTPQEVWSGTAGDPLNQPKLEKTTKPTVPNWLTEWSIPAVQSGQTMNPKMDQVKSQGELKNLDFKDLGRMGKPGAGIKNISSERADASELGSMLWPTMQTDKKSSEDLSEPIVVSDEVFSELLSETPTVPGTPDFKAQVTMGSSGQARLPTPVIHQIRDQVEQVAVSGMRTLPGGTQEMRIRLQPDNLGEIHLQVLTRGNQVGLRVLTSSAEAKQIFERSWNDLRDRLADKDLELGRIEVRSQEHELAREIGHQRSSESTWSDLLTQGPGFESSSGAWAPITAAQQHAGAQQDFSSSQSFDRNQGFDSAAGGYAQQEQRREAGDSSGESFGAERSVLKSAMNRPQRSGYGNSRIDLVA